MTLAIFGSNRIFASKRQIKIKEKEKKMAKDERRRKRHESRDGKEKEDVDGRLQRIDAVMGKKVDFTLISTCKRRYLRNRWP